MRFRLMSNRLVVCIVLLSTLLRSCGGIMIRIQ
jgi:hypothetical protein